MLNKPKKISNSSKKKDKLNLQNKSYYLFKKNINKLWSLRL